MAASGAADGRRRRAADEPYRDTVRSSAEADDADSPPEDPQVRTVLPGRIPLVLLALGRLRLALVHGLDQVAVALGDHPPLHLERRRELAGLLLEILGEHGEVLDRLP